MPNFQGYSKLFDKAMTDWLYGEWDEKKLRTYEVLNVIPGISQYMDYKLSVRRDEEYLNRYGMTYKDIHDPRKLTQVSAAGRSLQWVSHNIARLYK